MCTTFIIKYTRKCIFGIDNNASNVKFLTAANHSASSRDVRVIDPNWWRP